MFRVAGVSGDLGFVAGVGGEHEDACFGEGGLEPLGELEAGLLLEGDVAKQKSRLEALGALEGVGGGIAGFAVEAIGLVDQSKGVRAQPVVIHYKYTCLHHGNTQAVQELTGWRSCVGTYGARRRRGTGATGRAEVYAVVDF